MVPRPEDPYGIAKFAVEMDLKAAQQMFGIDHVIFRPHNVYGECQNIGDKYRNVVGIFMNQILRDEPMTIFGDGEQQRAFSYVGDVIGPLAAAPWTPGARNEVFNVGAETPYTVKELARAVATSMGVPNHPVVHLEARNEVRIAYSSHERQHAVFGETAQTDLAQGLERMSRWVKEVGSRQSRDFGEIEIVKNLPPSWAAVVAGNA
jgi:UDP-glucose 4-epimerase